QGGVAQRFNGRGDSGCYRFSKVIGRISGWLCRKGHDSIVHTRSSGSLGIMRSRSSITLHFRAEAYDHPSGYVDAGTVMCWLDKAGYASAATWAGSNVVANYIGNMRFGQPVPVDTQIAAQARLIYTEGTQVHVQARLALPEVLGDDGEPTVATWVVIVYEAIDAQGEPRVVKEWEPRTEAG